MFIIKLLTSKMMIVIIVLPAPRSRPSRRRRTSLLHAAAAPPLPRPPTLENAMKIENAVALVTGANRGLGLVFANELLARGARKVYAAARDPATVTGRGLHALRLDVDRPEDVAAAAALAPDVTLVINNAGIARPGGFLAAD